MATATSFSLNFDLFLDGNSISRPLMARHKHRWTVEEEKALTAGVERYGQGKWKVILSDPEFSSCLSDRSNIDLKDKWRNMNVSGGGLSRRNSVRTPMTELVTSNPPLSSPEPSVAPLLLEYGGNVEPSRSSPDTRTSPDYKAVILEALYSFEDPNGPDINYILDFIESNYEVPVNFWRSVTSKLRKLVLAGEVQNVNSCYKLNEKETTATLVPTETPEEAAARYVAEAEKLDETAIEACKRRDKLEELLEESLLMLMLAKKINEQSSRDDVVVLKPSSDSCVDSSGSTGG